MEDAVRLVGDVPELVVIGGGEVFQAALPLVNRMYLTFVDAEFPGTAFFPTTVPTPPGHRWALRDREAHQVDEKNMYPHAYVQVDRVALPGAPGRPFDIQALGILAKGNV
jgi:dihydrofolate reductase